MVYYEQAAAKGSVVATNGLAHIYETHLKDPCMAIQYFKQSVVLSENDDHRARAEHYWVSAFLRATKRL